MNAAPQTFTAAELSAALGITARAMRLRLMDVPAITKLVRGQRASAWALADLPSAVRDELADAAMRRGLPDAGKLLESPPAPWTAPVPWHELSADHRQSAEKLCAALAPVLDRQHELGGPDLMDLAATRYHQHFGHALEKEKLRYVMDRATRRDNHFHQWQRPELYFSEAAFKSALPAPVATAGLHDDLKEAVKAVQSISDPSFDDRRHLLPAAFRHLERLASARPSRGAQRADKLSLVQFLYHHVPGLHRPHAAGPDASKPLLAVRNLFNRVYQEWIALGRPTAMPADERAGNSGRKGYTHEPCEKIITGHAARLRGDHGAEGNLDLAIKWLSEKRHICAVCIEHFKPARLSASARRRLTPNAIQVAYFKGLDAVRKIAPTHHCDRSDTQAGDRFVIDDMTPNELTWDEVDGEIVSGQAQLLHTEDEASRYPLPFLLYIGAPNSHTIIKAISLVLTHAGLPHEALLTERGVFANRRTAGARGIQHQTDFRELQTALEKYFQFDALPDETLAEIRRHDLGLRDPVFRLNITQARSPQAKSIERSFFEFQKSASRLPGFAGFNQRHEKSRAMADFDRRVKIGKEHPGNEYLHLAELRKNYEMIFEEIAVRPSNGQVHRGRSPVEVWREAVTRRPLRKLPPEIEALLTTHRLPSVKVHPQGIGIALNRFDKAFYFNESTGPLVGRQVAVRINYELPDFIHVEHPDTDALMKVPRALTKSRTATPEQIAEVNRARRAHINGALGEIGNVENLFTAHVVRDNLHSKSDVARGAQIFADAEQHRAEKASAARKLKELQRRAGALGSPLPASPRSLSRVSESLDLEAQALAEMDAQEQGAAEGKP